LNFTPVYSANLSIKNASNLTITTASKDWSIVSFDATSGNVTLNYEGNEPNQSEVVLHVTYTNNNSGENISKSLDPISFDVAQPTKLAVNPFNGNYKIPLNSLIQFTLDKDDALESSLKLYNSSNKRVFFTMTSSFVPEFNVEEYTKINEDFYILKQQNAGENPDFNDKFVVAFRPPAPVNATATNKMPSNFILSDLDKLITDKNKGEDVNFTFNISFLYDCRSNGSIYAFSASSGMNLVSGPKTLSTQLCVADNLKDDVYVLSSQANDQNLYVNNTASNDTRKPIFIENTESAKLIAQNKLIYISSLSSDNSKGFLKIFNFENNKKSNGTFDIAKGEVLSKPFLTATGHVVLVSSFGIAYVFSQDATLLSKAKFVSNKSSQTILNVNNISEINSDKDLYLYIPTQLDDGSISRFSFHLNW
jgi:hypothetical protein